MPHGGSGSRYAGGAAHPFGGAPHPFGGDSHYGGGHYEISPDAGGTSSESLDTIGGVYEVVYDVRPGVPVTHRFERDSPVRATLPRGKRVVVDEIASKRDMQRVRARIRAPAGWVSLRTDDATFLQYTGTQAHSPAPVPASATPARLSGGLPLGMLHGIHNFAKNGDWPQVIRLLDSYPHAVNRRPQERAYGLIHFALWQVRHDVVYRLVDNYGADLNELTRDGETCLQVLQKGIDATDMTTKVNSKAKDDELVRFVCRHTEGGGFRSAGRSYGTSSNPSPRTPPGRLADDLYGTYGLYSDETKKDDDKALKEKVVKVFKRYDADDSGRIDSFEFARVLQFLDPEKWTDDRVEKLFDNIDTSNDCRISFHELLEWIFEGRGSVEDLGGP